MPLGPRQGIAAVRMVVVVGNREPEVSFTDWPMPGRSDSVFSVNPRFDRYVGIDYSGAKTPTASLKGLRIFTSSPTERPHEVEQPASPRRYWTRAMLAQWITKQVTDERIPTLVGIDHAFSFPYAYFLRHQLPLDWDTFLVDFQRHWPTDENIYVDFVRDGICGNCAARSGDPKWRRITEVRARGAKSVFHFDVQGQVAKSTHAGLPWLLNIRQATKGRVHFWPFDGWEVPVGRSAVAEVYPALWSRSFAPENRNSHQHDAYSIAAWMCRADCDGDLARFMVPRLSLEDQRTAEFEGWILGVA